MKNKLSKAQYWEWRTTIEEMAHAKSKLDNKRLMYSLMDKDIEILRLKLHIYKEQVELAEKHNGDCKKEYDRCREQLEKDLGRSLKDVVIDDLTFEIKELG